MVVYQPWTGPQTHSEKDYVKELSMKDFLKLRSHGKLKEYESLAKKLDLVKFLIAENHLEKLKKMMQRGEI